MEFWYLALLIPLLWVMKKLYFQEGLFIPLPMETVRKMLEIAEIMEDDILYDLGSGDGRTVIEAWKGYGIESVGIENWAPIYYVSKLRLRLSGAGDNVKILKKDIFKTDLSKATVVTMYLTPKLNAMLKNKFERELRKGTRVVSASHPMIGWEYVRKVRTGHFWTYLYRI